MNYSYDRRKTARGARLESKLKRQVNSALDKAGFGGRRKFRKIGEALGVVSDVLSQHGIEPDEVLSAHKFPEAGGSTSVRLAFSNTKDPFSPEEITNSMLALQWTVLRDGVVEVIAYLS